MQSEKKAAVAKEYRPGFFETPLGHGCAVVGAVVFGFLTLGVLLWR